MGQLLHGSARKTHAVRAVMQRSKASNAALSRELGINVKTVAKGRKRDGVQDAAMGPKEAHSTVLGIEEEAVNGSSSSTSERERYSSKIRLALDKYPGPQFNTFFSPFFEQAGQ